MKALSEFYKRSNPASGVYDAYCGKCKYKYERDRKARHAGEADLTIEARWNALAIRIEEGCWGWKGRINPDGYAQIIHCQKNAQAARVGFVLATGLELGRTERLRSTCGNRGCVRPDHWERPRMVNAPKLNTKRGKSLRARRDRRILLEVDAAIPAGLPQEVREEMRQELVLEALTGSDRNRCKLTAQKVRRALSSAWDKTFGDPRQLSIDVSASADDEDGMTYRDLAPDASIFSDPGLLVDVARRFAEQPPGND